MDRIKPITTYNLARMNRLLHGVKDAEFEIFHGVIGGGMYSPHGRAEDTAFDPADGFPADATLTSQG